MKEKTYNLKTIGVFSARILLREWKKFVLPFLSLTFTTLIVFTVLLFTNSSSLFLAEKNKELIGGDISIESNYALDQESLSGILGTDIVVTDRSDQYDFSGIVVRGEASTPVSISVVDAKYPVYGSVSVEGATYVTPTENEIYIDKNTQTKLGVTVGDDIVYANKNFTVRGIIEKDSTSLLSGFSFLPKVLISTEGFARTAIDRSLLRAEYTYTYMIERASTATLTEIVDRENVRGVQIDIAGITQPGFVEGLSLVEQFLILAVLLSCILAAVNIYAGMLYILTIMKKSFAVLLALGFSKKNVGATLSASLIYVLLVAMLLGGGISLILFNSIRGYILAQFGLALPFVNVLIPSLLTVFVVCSISFASFVPSLRSLMRLSPKILLSGGQEQTEKNVFANFIIITLSTLIPLVLIAIFLLESFLYGLISIFVIIGVYVALAVVFYYLIVLLYKKRYTFSFLQRTLISYKYKDGLFGIVSLTSLYVALTALSLLILLQSTLITFIQKDLGEKVPSVYIVDIQKSQTDAIKENFKDVTLFSNVGARILSIDELDIQKAVALSDGSVSREFGREYNLTYRDLLLPNEKVVKGTWLTGQANEVSVEKEFAERANITMGSRVVFSVQGFEIDATVTSLRETDSRSGLPFFYFVFNPKDLEKYPATFFGYSYVDTTEKAMLSTFLAQNFPNISVIDTTEITAFAENIISGLLVIVFVIAIPPLVLALFLIVTLIISSFEGRRKQSAQMMALGAKKKFIEKLYYLETISTTVVSAILGYFTAVAATVLIGKYYLKIKTVSLYNVELLIALGGILVVVIALAHILWKGDKKPLRELLSYEER